eukprot:CAMPEP_0197688312 /NCGR_PEP_ID=MMETSP1338-20131121/105238_1 /TAXON_ID=43686 ORGANISM="Pelagodinium beii, Strain RCC1491" /NCGR_SAMPLE_ID=MMETSP1338 /ASSEMBLY_ACC=CAM_ASM_000754 /LENGTH=32 /DNA_ID= /DNA_START= /DNA_END= /DNA_ORIENTATION=
MRNLAPESASIEGPVNGFPEDARMDQAGIMPP